MSPPGLDMTATTPLPLSIQALAVGRAPAAVQSPLTLAAVRREQSEPALPPAIQRLVDAGAARVEHDGEIRFAPPETAPSPPAQVQRAAPAIASAVSAGEAAPASHRVMSDRELDDLAHRLYPRFRTRFGRELLLDRERAGKLIDQ